MGYGINFMVTNFDLDLFNRVHGGLTRNQYWYIFHNETKFDKEKMDETYKLAMTNGKELNCTDEEFKRIGEKMDRYCQMSVHQAGNLIAMMKDILKG